ncbi:MAG TPA: GNAT family N-acetyltransferase, partial [Arthrobacter sp.]|nr:GNAT family N-acetyltransferase [Arthrobacter sp.]
AGPAITFWTAREDAGLLGCGALKELQRCRGEIKSMRTAAHARGRGIATLLLTHILAEARLGGYDRLYLETGSQDFFAPARRLYQRHGFSLCPPFADYGDDPNSVYMTLALDPGRP